MIVVVPFCGKDEALVLKNLEWCRSLEPSVPFKALIIHDDLIGGEDVKSACGGYFSEVGEIKYPHWTGRMDWPMPQNFQFQEAASHIFVKNKNDAWFWWEADATPLKAGWLQEIEGAHKAGGKAFSGNIVGEPYGHMTGVGVYPWNLPCYSGAIMSTLGVPWDVAGKAEVIPHVNKINHLIQHVWERDGAPFSFSDKADADSVLSKTAVIFHRCKDGSLIDAINGAPIVPKLKRLTRTFVRWIRDRGPDRIAKRASSSRVKFSISILAHGKIDATKKCLESVFKHSTQPYELILTDNASYDGTAWLFEKVASTHDNVTIVRNRVNRGFVSPNNKALSISSGDYFITLNNDAEVPAKWLEKLEEPFRMFADAAISGPSGGCCAWGRDSFKGKTGDLEYVEGACMCCKSSIVKQHGLFAPYIHFAYCEDADLSLRMRALGYSIHRCNFSIAHNRGTTSGGVPGIKRIAERNAAELTRRWGHYLKTRRLDSPILVRRKDAIGDVLLTTPVIRALKSKFPAAQIYVESNFPDLFWGNENVFASYRFVGSPSADAMIVDLNMAYENRPMRHIVDAYMEVAAVDGDNKLTFRVAEESDAWAKQNMQVEPGRMVCAVHADNSMWAGKRWPVERFAEVASKLKRLGWVIVAIGTDKESASKLSADVDLSGKCTFNQLGAVLKMCSLFVGGDSFPMHLSQAVGTPTVAVFGATLPEFIMTDSSRHVGIKADKSVHCAGSRHMTAGMTFAPCDGECIRSVTVDKVMSAIDYITRTSI